MKKVRVYQRKDRAGWYVQWREDGRRLSKQCNTKTEADHYSKMKYMAINNDIYTAIDLPWQEVVDEYLMSYDVRGLTEASKYEAKRFLSAFLKMCSPRSSQSVVQRMCEWFILQRQKQQVSRYTVNKDIGRLRAFIRWMSKRGYSKNNIELTMLKTDRRMVKALTTEQIRQLFKDAPTPAWRCRLLLSLVTGLRKSDIDRLLVSDLDLDRAVIDTRSQKTRKGYIDRPLPKAAIPELKGYFESLPDNQVKLFADVNARKVWDSFKNGCTRQDLRVTFSTLIQKVGSIGSAQHLLEHYSSKTTSEFYTDQELILRWKVDQLPVGEWLNGQEE